MDWIRFTLGVIKNTILKIEDVKIRGFVEV